MVLWATACGGGNSQAAGTTAETETNSARVTPAAATEPEPSAATEDAAPCTTLVDKLCRDLVPETETCGLVRERVAELDALRCKGLLHYYSEVLDDLRQQEARNQPLPAAAIAKLTQDGIPSLGPSNAPVTLILFSDFQCPFCAGAAATTHDVVQRYGDQIGRASCRERVS
jgi:hypothetical protein